MTGPHADQLWDGRYRLVRRLGVGGMASVWLARDERLGREVAVKVLSDVLAGDREYIARFEREAQVAAKLNHANLVTIFDFAVAGDRPYLVMELIPGGTVATRAAQGGLPPAEVERLAEELLAALEHIHRAGVI
ncbi:MAG: protein kinase domain-containing protein, partial [Thermoleophilaceae bacterium]